MPPTAISAAADQGRGDEESEQRLSHRRPIFAPDARQGDPPGRLARSFLAWATFRGRMTPEPTDPLVHAVIVSYRSADTLRGCVEPLTRDPARAGDCGRQRLARRFTGDDRRPRRRHRSARRATAASPTAAISVPRGATAPYLLFLNPDARMEPEALEALLDDLRANPAAGLVGPADPRARATSSRSASDASRGSSTTFAQALFLHRLWPQAAWSDELIRDEAQLRRTRAPPTGCRARACSSVASSSKPSAASTSGSSSTARTPICAGASGTPGTRCASCPRPSCATSAVHSSGAGETQPILARSRVLYARKHDGAGAARLQAAGIALGEATHALAALKRPRSRRGHMAALRTVLGR